MPMQIVELVVDRSGSMRGKETDTVGGINACISELRSSKDEDDIIEVSLKLFDHEQNKIWTQINLNDVPEFARYEFVPRGQTALLDAMGDSLSFYKQMKNDTPMAFDTCVIYVATDGLENNSSKYTRETIKSLIEEAERDYNITIMYLAANQDAILEASRLGIAGDRAINYDETPEGIQAVYRSAGSAAARTRSGSRGGFLGAERQASQPSSTNHQAFNPPPITRNNAALQPPPLAPIRQPVFPYPPNAPSPPQTVPEWKQHLFLDAAKNKNWTTVRGLLEETPELVNVVGGAANRWTALHQAAEQNNEEIVTYLLEKGADKTIATRNGYTASVLTSNANLSRLLA
jgi:uncharacterized protein YegL